MILKILAALFIAVSAAAIAAPWNAGPGVIFPPIAASGTTQVLLGGAVLASSSDRYLPISHYTSSNRAADYIASLFPVGGSLSNFRVNTTVPPTGAQTWVFTVNKNGNSTAITCTINASSSPAGTCTDSTNTTPVTAGDYFDVQSRTTNTPASSIHSVSAIFTPTTSNDTIITSDGSAFSTSVQNAVTAFNVTSPGTLANCLGGIIAAAGAIDKLFVRTNAPGTPASGKSYAWAFSKNGSTTSAPTCTITDDAVSCNDTATSALTIADGDNLSFAGTPTGTPTAAAGGFSARFVPTTSGQFIFINTGSTANDSGTVTTYFGLTGAVSATEASAQSVSNSMTIDKMEVKLSGTAGGGGKAFTLNIGGTPSALTCSIAAGATTCSATGTITVADGDLLAVADVPTSTPTVRAATISIQAHR